MIIKTSIGKLDAPQELEPSTRQLLHSQRQPPAAPVSSRPVQTRASLEHARATIDDLVQSNTNNDEPFQTVHVLHRIDNEPLPVGGARFSFGAARLRWPSPRRRA